jgi:predicted acylesterase/phospholipase RssA
MMNSISNQDLKDLKDPSDLKDLKDPSDLKVLKKIFTESGTKGPKYLLSLDGGAVKGVITMQFLYLLEQDLIKNFGKTIYDIFDFYSGSSAGAIISSLIVYSGMKTMSEISETIFSEKLIKQIFTKNKSLYTKIFAEPLYDGSKKAEIIKKYIGTSDITETNGKYTMYTVYSISEQVPKYYKSYSFADDTKFTINNNSTNIVDSSGKPYIPINGIIDASSAAPLYFNSVEYNDKNGVQYGIDGSLFANNPTDSAYADSLRLFGPKEDIRILSIGTGDYTFKKLGSQTKFWGGLNWLFSGNIFDVILDTDPILVDYKMKHFSEALGHKYVRVHGPVDIAFDDVTKFQELKDIGTEWYNQYKDQLFNDFFQK